jgi:hypothetical protein
MYVLHVNGKDDEEGVVDSNCSRTCPVVVEAKVVRHAGSAVSCGCCYLQITIHTSKFEVQIKIPGKEQAPLPSFLVYG